MWSRIFFHPRQPRGTASGQHFGIDAGGGGLDAFLPIVVATRLQLPYWRNGMREIAPGAATAAGFFHSRNAKR
jgi:hypothetical protein